MSSRSRRQVDVQANTSDVAGVGQEPAVRERAGRPVPAERQHPSPPALADGAEAQEDEEGAPPAPWHFKVLLVGTAGYLIYRLIWFIFWLTGHAWHG